MRTFIAIDFPPEIIKKIDQVINYFKTQTPESAIKWVAPENLHLTIKFIGDISDDILPQAKFLISDALKNQPAINISIEGLGMFPDAKNPRVIWLGIIGGDPLVKIHESLDQRLKAIQIKPDRRGYSPHLTIARVRRQTDQKTARLIGETLSKFNVDSLGAIRVDEIRLYQSDLTPKGPTYSPLLSVPLNKV